MSTRNQCKRWLRSLIFLFHLVFRTWCVFYTSSTPQFTAAVFRAVSGHRAGPHRLTVFNSVLSRSLVGGPPFHVPDLKGNNPEVLPEESGLMVFGRFPVTSLKFLFSPILSRVPHCEWS